MHVDDMILVSIDDHVDRAARHVRAPRAGEVPRPASRTSSIGDDGIEQWMFEGQQIGLDGPERGRHAGPRRSGASTPSSFAEMRPGAYDIHERVRDMNRNGILASMCFPTFAGFSGRHVPGGRPTRTSRSPCCRPTTTGTSTSGAPRTPAGSSRSPSRRSGTRSAWPPRCAASRPRAAARSRCPSCRTSRACPATTTSTTGTRSSEPCPRSRS